MYCRSRPQYRSDLGWILGVAFLGTLTRSARPAQGFTYVRCCSAPPASSPHGLTAPGRVVSRRPTRVQLPSACGCFQLAPQRTCTSNPGSMPGTPSPRADARPFGLRGLTPISASNQGSPCNRRLHVAQQPIAIAGSNGLPVFRTPKHSTNSLRIAATTICLGLRRPRDFNRATSATIAGLCCMADMAGM
jgi:hypothetical protein